MQKRKSNGHKTKREVVHDVARDNLTFKFLRYISGLSNSEAGRGTEAGPNKRPVSPSTIRNPRRPVKDGGTRYPQARTLMRVLEAQGARLDIVKGTKVWE